MVIPAITSSLERWSSITATEDAYITVDNSGVQEDEIELATISTNASQTSGSYPEEYSSGWSLLGTGQDGTGYVAGGAMWRKFDPAQYSTESLFGWSDNNARDVRVRNIRIRNGEEVADSAFAWNQGISITLPEVTAQFDNSLLVRIYENKPGPAGDNYSSSLADHTLHVHSYNTISSARTLEVWWKVVNAGVIPSIVAPSEDDQDVGQRMWGASIIISPARLSAPQINFPPETKAGTFGRVVSA